MVIKKKTILIENKKFILRKLRINDEQMLKRFFLSLSSETKKWYSPHSFDDKTAEEICSKKDKFFERVIILYNKDIIGYCVVFLGLRKWERIRYNGKFEEKEVCTIAPCVHEKFQHIGLGMEMIKYVIDISLNYNKKVIFLYGGVVVKNKKAVNFYKKLNFNINRKWLHPLKKVMSYDMYLEI